MGKNIFWNPKLADKYLEEKAMDRLRDAAQAMADEVEKNTPVGTEERPIYKTGPYAGQYWTARDNGALKESVRVTESQDGDGNSTIERFNRNVWVMCGNRKAYYGKIVEFNKSFFRTSINRAKRKAAAILRGA